MWEKEEPAEAGPARARALCAPPPRSAPGSQLPDLAAPLGLDPGLYAPIGVELEVGSRPAPLSTEAPPMPAEALPPLTEAPPSPDRKVVLSLASDSSALYPSKPGLHTGLSGKQPPSVGVANAP